MARQGIRRRSQAQVRADVEAVLAGGIPADQPAKPKRKNRHIESQHGRALIQWRNHAMTARPLLRWLHHIPNGVVFGSEKLAGMMKAEGLTKGVLDYFLPVAHFLAECSEDALRRRIEERGGNDGLRDPYLGLYIELKAPGLENHKNGGMSDDQVEFATFAHQQGYVVVLCYHWHQARDAIVAYLDGKAIPHLWSPPA